MITNDFRIRMVAKATIYAAMLKKHKNRRRWLVAGESALFAVVLVLSVVLQTYFEIKPPTYTLDASTYSLIGESRDDTAQYLSENFEDKAFNFVVPKSEDAGASQHTGRVADAYEASFPKDASDGVSVTDTSSKITMTLVPKFRTGEGRKVDGDHIVYPLGAQKLIYTLKYNGLKEDIIVPKYLADTLDYTFDLKLPGGVEARLDSQGNIGIYSSDPNLFGDVSFGSDEDKARVDKARQNGAKTHLVATIPAPIVKDNDGNEHSDKAKFTLGNKRSEQTTDTSTSQQNLPDEVKAQLATKSTSNVYELTLAASNLQDLSYPISIDPTFTLTSAGDFTRVNNEGGTEVDATNGLIRRGGLTGGVTNTWTSAASASYTKHSDMGTANYGNFLYMTGGLEANGSSTPMNTVQYSTLDSSGEPSAWTNTTVLPAARWYHDSIAYNGYLYVVGGRSGASDLNTVLYAPIKADGSIGAWVTSTATMTTARRNGKIEINNGYMYAIGGSSSGTVLSSTEYAPILADGSVGTWTATASLPDGRRAHDTTMYNGFIYVLGGFNSSNVRQKTTYYSKISADGTLASWTQTTDHLEVRTNLAVVAKSGYLHIYSGCNANNVGGGCSSFLNSTEYVAINADGSVGNWRSNTTAFNANSGANLESVGEKLYVLGGCTATTLADCTNGNGNVLSATIKPAGWTNSWTADTDNMATPRSNHVQLIYNGYIYALGGRQDASTILNTVHYTQIQSDGSIGAWSTTTNLPGYRYYGAGFIYNGYIYFLGGTGGTLASTSFESHQDTVYYAPINTNGTLGSWATTTSLTTPRRTNTATVYNGYAYHLGGFNGSYHNTVHYASINSNGTLGSWTATASFTNARSGHRTVANNGFLYVMGGWNGATTYGDVQYASINSNGSINSWSATTSMPDERRVFLASANKGYLYVTGGGYGTDSSRDTTSFSKFNSDGTLGAWTTSTNVMPEGRASAEGMSIYNDMLYLTAGDLPSGGPAYRSNTYYASLNNGGSGNVGAWTEDAAPYAGGRRYHQVIAYNGYIYTMGGCFQNDCAITGAQTGGVEYAPLNSDGSVGAWASTSGFAARDSFGAVALNGYMYVTDGSYRTGVLNTLTQRNEMLYAQINSDGTLGTFNTTTNQSSAILFSNNLDTLYKDVSGSIYYTKPAVNGTISSWTLASHTLIANTYHAGYVVYKGYIYRIGGCTRGFLCDATNTRLDVEFAPVDQATGNTTAAFKLTNSLSLKRFVAGDKAFALNGYIILPPDGGPDGIGGLSFAPILPGGELGNWTQGRAMPVYHPSNAHALYNGVLYVNGGANGSGTPMHFTHYASVQSTARKGVISKRYDFDVGVKPTKLITRGTKHNGARVGVSHSSNVACGATAFDNAQTTLDTGYAGINALSLTLGTSRTLARCLFLRYTIDDSLSAVFPDSGNETTITDFDVYFTSNPGNRLRGGRTFTNGADRGLDASP